MQKPTFYKSKGGKRFVCHYNEERFLIIDFAPSVIETDLPEICYYPKVDVENYLPISRADFGRAYAEAATMQLSFISNLMFDLIDKEGEDGK